MVGCTMLYKNSSRCFLWLVLFFENKLVPVEEEEVNPLFDGVEFEMSSRQLEIWEGP